MLLVAASTRPAADPWRGRGDPAAAPPRPHPRTPTAEPPTPGRPGGQMHRRT